VGQVVQEPVLVADRTTYWPGVGQEVQLVAVPAQVKQAALQVAVQVLALRRNPGMHSVATVLAEHLFTFVPLQTFVFITIRLSISCHRNLPFAIVKQ